MNQKYLQGLSSNMESPNEAVFSEATPENITAFLMISAWAVCEPLTSGSNPNCSLQEIFTLPPLFLCFANSTVEP